MSDTARDFQPDVCLLCEAPVVCEQRYKRVDGGLVHMSCWMDETQPETQYIHSAESESQNG